MNGVVVNASGYGPLGTGGAGDGVGACFYPNVCVEDL